MKTLFRLAFFSAIAASTLGTLPVTTQPAQAQMSYRNMSCGQLWFARNNIYARKGHCFQTRRGRRNFGRNCFPPYGRLNRSERRRVARIKRWENINGC